MRLSYEEEVRGRTVVDATGRAVGDVLALFVDTGELPERLTVDAIRVRLRNEVADELGVARGAFHHATLDVPARVLQAIGDAVVLQVPIQSLVAETTAHGDAHR